MKSDFTRKTFDPDKHYSRVMMQQGRVTVDADPNEQTDILLHYLRTLAADLIGPYAAPVLGGGFQLSADENGKLLIGAGRYYVNGILVENEETCPYSEQPSYPAPPDDPLLKEMSDPSGKTLWVYLDVWERNITYLDDPAIREVALGGPDTCSRSQVVWQVKAKEIAATPAGESRAALERQKAELERKIAATRDPDELAELRSALAEVNRKLAALGGAAAQAPTCAGPLADLAPHGTGVMSARVDPGYVSDDPCVLGPQAKYRGTENHLYRVEVHEGGKAGAASFKWSRDNGSVVAAWLGTSGNDLQVSSGRGFTAGIWVELIDDDKDLLGLPGLLVKLAGVEGNTLSVDPSSIPTGSTIAWSETLATPKVRRWDQKQAGDVMLNKGAVLLVESTATEIAWIDLEDGIQIQFAPGGEYRTGDYWLIPARVATGNIEWPATPEGPKAIPPDGIHHHYAPLGFATWRGRIPQLQSCRCEFDPLSSCFSGIGSLAVGAGILRPTRMPLPIAASPATFAAGTRTKRPTRRRKEGNA